MNSEQAFDVIVIGGGPSGLMAAISARETGATTLLIEKGNRLGRKLGISGGGRCNVTNAKPLDELMRNIPGNGRFLHSALSRFSNVEVMRFFEGLGIRLKEEDRGRVFPVSDKAATVVKALVDYVYRVGVEVWEDTPVHKIVERGNQVTGVKTAMGVVRASAVIVATGGASVPKTGSTGDAYPWARSLGHTVVEPYPTEVPLTSEDWYIRDKMLQGISVRGTSVEVLNARHKRLTIENGDVLFTHFGLSGPAALRCSHYVSTQHRKNPNEPLTAHIDLSPDKTAAEWSAMLETAKRENGRKSMRNLLTTSLPERTVDVILMRADADPATQVANLPNQSAHRLVELIKRFPVGITGTLPLDQATVTGGGVSVKEIDPRTMASKVCLGLYFCGEVMDVHAHTGGYNITVAFSTGHLAGESAATYARGLVAPRGDSP